MPSKDSLGKAKKEFDQPLSSIESAQSGAGREELEDQKMPSWKHRRRLIYMTFILGLGMILFGAATYVTDTAVSSQLVIGGVALISIILTAYTGFAAFEDVKLWGQYGKSTPLRFEEGESGSLEPEDIEGPTQD
jgi:hypothetical protein